ncbi:MAG TPA: hypothetical protein VFB78_07160 [Acidimicrobiales bacterium]|nr:hypothetical protein [Acidimicrobiales bacterium]
MTERGLRIAAAVYAVGLAVHTVDHFRRGLDVITPYVFWGGNVSTVIGLIAVALIFARHRLAPLAAVWAGLPIAIGVASVHLLPHWSELSDAFPGSTTGVTAMSWFAVLTEIAGASAVGLIGFSMLRRSLAGDVVRASA